MKSGLNTSQNHPAGDVARVSVVPVKMTVKKRIPGMPVFFFFFFFFAFFVLFIAVKID